MAKMGLVLVSSERDTVLELHSLVCGGCGRSTYADGLNVRRGMIVGLTYSGAQPP